MKVSRYFVRFLMLVICLAAFSDVLAQERIGGDLVISGTVRDRTTRKNLANVTVSVTGTSIGTVTNADGVFSLKIPHELSDKQLELVHVSYVNVSMPLSEPIADDVFLMTPVALQLEEAIVYGGNARLIVEEALRRIPENYSSRDNLASTFYRETIQKNNRYISVSEAMMDVYKTDYSYRGIVHDRVQLVKARRLLSQRINDTLSVKVAGGPNLSLILDVVKNPDLLFDRETIDFYEFEQEPSVLIDDRVQYVIGFKPVVSKDYALFIGKLYIDRERLSFTRAEFFLDLDDPDKAVASILVRKPVGLRFRPLEVKFLVSYRDHDGTASLNYICNEIRFKCDWRRRLFSSTYTACSEMVVVESEVVEERMISRKEAFGTKQIFYDAVKDYWHDEGFWKDYNIIEPTEKLENAVKRLRK